MRNRKSIFYLFILALFLLFVPIGATVTSSFTSQTFVFAEETSSTTLSNYLSACNNLLDDKIVNYCSADAQTYMDAYVSARNSLTESDKSEIEKNTIVNSAETKYTKLFNQKSYIQDYNKAGNELNKIGNVSQSNKNSVQKKVDNYKNKRQVLVDNGLNSALESDVAKTYDARLATIERELNSLKEQIYRPFFNSKFDGFVYDGNKHWLAIKPDAQLADYAIIGYDPNTMEFVGVYNDCGRMDVGEYEIRIKPQDGFEWSSGENKGETLSFKFQIVKATYKYLDFIKLSQKSVVYNGQGFGLELILEDSEEARLALSKDGYDFDTLKNNAEVLLEVQDLSVKYYYNNVVTSTVTSPGNYEVVAEIVGGDSKNYNAIQPLYSTLVINDVTIYKFDEQLVEKASLSVDKTGFIVPGTSLIVKEITAEEFPLDPDSTKFRRYISENEEIAFSYDIKIDGNIAGKLELRVLLPEVVKGKDFKLLHVHGNEEYYEVDVVDYTIDGDYVVFNLVDFSTFSFVCEKDAVTPWWVIFLICFASLVVVLAGVYLVLFFIWKKKGSTKLVALVPYFKVTYKAFYKLEYKDNQALPNESVKLLDVAPSDEVIESGVDDIQQDVQEDIVEEETIVPSLSEEKHPQEISHKKANKGQSPKTKKVGRPKKEKIEKPLKGRGRPRKEKVETAPKKRGRPKKIEETPKVEKKRGRPKKEETSKPTPKRGRPKNK